MFFYIIKKSCLIHLKCVNCTHSAPNITHSSSHFTHLCPPASTLHCAVIKGAWKAKKSLTVELFHNGSLYCTRPSGLLQYPSSLCSGLHRHLVADICTEQRGQLELQPKFWLCSCQLERQRHREIQVCLLQFSSRPKITTDAHISDIMSCCTILDSGRAEMMHVTDDAGVKNIPLCAGCVWRGLFGLIIPAAFTKPIN